MVGLRLAGDLGEIVITKGELVGEGEVIGDIALVILLFNGGAGATESFQPGAVSVRRVTAGGRIGRMWEMLARGAGESAEIIIKGMVFFDDDDDVVNRVVRFHMHLFCALDHSSWTV